MKLFGWTLVLGGAVLLLGTVISEPMTLGMGIFGPIPHMIGVGLIFWGRGLILSGSEKTAQNNQARKAAGWIGFIAGVFLTLVCVSILVTGGYSAVKETIELYQQGIPDPSPLIGLALILIFAVAGFFIALISYKGIDK